MMYEFTDFLEFIDKTIPKQNQEVEHGNREYKMFLDINIESKSELRKNQHKTEEILNYQREIKLNTKINKRASQLLYRLEEGQGKAIYMIGIKDDGTVEGIHLDKLYNSITFLYKMIKIINANIKKIRVYKGSQPEKYMCVARIEMPDYTHKKLHIY